MRITKVGTPVTSADGKNAQLGDGDGGADGGRNLLGGLDTKTDVALGVTDNNDGLETGTLTGTGLLLDGFDLDPSAHAPIPSGPNELELLELLPLNPMSAAPTFITSSFNLGRKKSTIWYSLMGRECR